ncbi:hypothetical protein GLAREA_10160 [Glarea lozoyensis ATCC 20868]|uniref:Uncharacterized protein n=1 Tax=Glarea lozoyensis (strain ATCC 20868 / MF5171) TaxID=1116229 RepID=S3DR16_GLAL2|nr:uncharacterized protein GLAREA_10160 [Glarea lozoyensis ATCC 20868]EPE34466.1 hypothetical protein GLAREA_10160 [Glarea lozoyensis ATCC 20868]
MESAAAADDFFSSVDENAGKIVEHIFSMRFELQITRLGVWTKDGRVEKTMGYSKAKSTPRRKPRHVLGVQVLERRIEECLIATLRSVSEHKITITIGIN